MNAERYIGDSKMHEMVAVAMEENWDGCRAHVDRITGAIAKVIADGIGNGEFQVSDAYLAAVLHLDRDGSFFSHPQLIAECAEKPSPTLDQMIDFVVGGLQGAASTPAQTAVARGAPGSKSSSHGSQVGPFFDRDKLAMSCRMALRVSHAAVILVSTRRAMTDRYSQYVSSTSR